MSQFRTPPCTPSKIYTQVVVSPRSKSAFCIYCAKLQANDSYKRKLYKDNEKTETCKIIEEFLGLEIDTSLSNIVCKLCLASVRNTTTKINALKKTFAASEQQFKDRFGKSKSKRLSVDSPMKREKKKSKAALWVDDKENNEEQLDLLGLGVAPLENCPFTVSKTLQKSSEYGRVKHSSTKCSSAQTEAEIPADPIEIWVSVINMLFYFTKRDNL